MAIKISGTTVIPDTLGSANQVLKINAGGSAGEWADASGGIAYVAKTANYTANINEGVVTDTSGGVFTVTLPASPSEGDLVVIADGAGTWDTNNLTVARNGETIDGDAENLVMDVEGAKVDFIYDGADWNVFSKAGFVTTASSFNETEFTATASQTTFVVSYTAGLVSVYLNGVRLAATDYTATNGTTVVLATGATAGDLVEVVAWSVFDVANVATAGQGSLADSAVQPADSFDAANLTGTAAAINGSNITNLASANLTGALPAIDGSALTGVTGGNLGVFSIRDEKATNTAAQTLAANTWNIRDLQTTDVNTLTGASLAANVITLPEGTFDVEGLCKAYRSNGTKARLYDITNSATLVVSTADGSHSSFYSGVDNHIIGRITVASGGITCRLEQNVQTLSGGGVGAFTTSETSIYSYIKFTEVT